MPFPPPTDLGPVLVPDGSPDAVREGSGICLRVSPEKGLCALCWGGVRSRTSMCLPAPQALSEGVGGPSGRGARHSTP